MRDDDPDKPAPPPQPSRRGFLKRAALLGAGAGLLGQAGACATSGGPAPAPPPPATPAVSGEVDFSRSSAALERTRTVHSACQFCNANCGLRVHTNHGRVVAVEGFDDDPVQAGGLCVKAELMTQLVYNPHRLKRPMIRASGAKGDLNTTWREVSWEEALETIARRFLKLRDAGQAHTIANRTSGRMLRGAGDLIARFFALLGSPNNADVGPVCNDAGGNALAWTLGLGQFTNGYGIDPATGQEDLGAARMLLFLGTNQAETHPVTFAHLLRHRARTGAKLVVVDPRKTPTAAHGDRWLAPRPHTDLALALGMIHTIIDRGWHDAAYVARWVTGFDELKAHVREHGYDAAWAASVCDVPAEAIVALARDYAAARPAAIFCNAGISHQLGAFDTYRALTMLAAITGNIGVPGGGCNFMHNTWPGGLTLPPLPARPAPSARPALPVGPDSFADAILTGAPYPLRAIMTEGNPLQSSANTGKVREAFKALEFYVYTGLFMEEAAWYADVILPVCSGLETTGVYMRRDDRAIRWQDAAVERVGACRTDVEIWIDLAHAMARLDTQRPASDWTRAFPLAWRDYNALWAEFVARTPGAGGMTAARLRERAEPLRWPCPTLEHPGVSTMYLDHPSWYAAAEALGAKPGARFLTPSGRIELFTPELDAKLAGAGHGALPIFYTHPEVRGDLPTLRYDTKLVRNPLHPNALTPRVTLGAPPEVNLADDWPLMGIIGRSSVVHFAGVTHWTQTGKQLNGVRLVQLHPRTAKRAGIRDGDAIVVESPRGRIQATALVWKEIREDTIFVPNGFGFAQRVGPETGAPLYAEAANALIDDRYFDNLSGQQAYKCFACRVRPA